MVQIIEQPRLPIAREFQIALGAIRHRLGRSILTLCIIALAVTFLMETATEAVLGRACNKALAARSDLEQALLRLAALLRGKISADELRRSIAGMPADSWLLPAIGPWLGLSDEELPSFREDCARAEMVTEYLDGLSTGVKRQLTGKRSDTDLLLELEQPAAQHALRDRAQLMRLTLPKGFWEYVASRRALEAQLSAAAEAFNQSLARSGLSPQTLRARLGLMYASPTSRPSRSWLTGSGLRISDPTLDLLAQQAREQIEEEALLSAVSQPRVMAAWSKQSKRVYNQESMLRLLRKDPLQAHWLRQQLSDDKAMNTISDEQMQQSAARILDLRQLNQTLTQLDAEYGSGLSGRSLWLVVVALLLCVAGISNAIITSVIERFAEIATMKCLGARDGFIGRLFIAEALFLGLIGGVVGTVFGLLIGWLRVWSACPELSFSFLPKGQMAGAMVLSLLCGLFLSALAGGYPAFSASRMPPIRAMRVEQAKSYFYDEGIAPDHHPNARAAT